MKSTRTWMIFAIQTRNLYVITRVSCTIKEISLFTDDLCIILARLAFSTTVNKNVFILLTCFACIEIRKNGISTANGRNWPNDVKVFYSPSRTFLPQKRMRGLKYSKIQSLFYSQISNSIIFDRETIHQLSSLFFFSKHK